MKLIDQHYKNLNPLFDKIFNLYDTVIISSGTEKLYAFDDQNIPFRCNPYFSYFFPFISDSGHFLLLDKSGNKSLFINKVDDFWHKHDDYQPSAEVSNYWSVDFFKDTENLYKHFKSNFKGKVALISNQGIDGFDYNPQALLDIINESRFVKTEFEIDCIKRANKKAVKGHIAAKKAWKEGCSEFEINLRYCEAANLSGPELPYENIIGLNENASFLHYHGKNHERPKQRLSFLIDAGATHLNYHSDISRTYGNDDMDFKNILFQLERVQLSICESVKAGVDFVELHKLAHQKIAELLNYTKVIDLNSSEIFKQKLTNYFFPHGLGHSIGLNVHDVWGNDPEKDSRKEFPFLRMNRVLKSGCVITIEPGVYFIKSLLDDLKKGPYRNNVNWKLVDKLKKCGGVRVEDDILVTEKGHNNLTREAFENGE
ncbi:MAG: Xaa-Pro dipeptidase [Bacteriovoracaceae bacterium]